MRVEGAVTTWTLRRAWSPLQCQTSAIIAGQVDLHLELSGDGSLRLRFEHALRDAVRRLPPGTRLPPTRALAVELGVSRGVVVEGYAQLAAEGYLHTRRGGGTFVAASESSIGQSPNNLTLAARRRDRTGPLRAPKFDLRPALPALDGRSGPLGDARCTGRCGRRRMRGSAIPTRVGSRSCGRRSRPRSRGGAGCSRPPIRCSSPVGSGRACRSCGGCWPRAECGASATEDPCWPRLTATLTRAGPGAGAGRRRRARPAHRRAARRRRRLRHPRPSVPDGRGARARAPRGADRVGARPRRARDRGRLRRRVPLRPPAGRLAPGAGARRRALWRVGVEDARARVAARVARAARRASASTHPPRPRSSISSRSRTCSPAATSTGTSAASAASTSAAAKHSSTPSPSACRSSDLRRGGRPARGAPPARGNRRARRRPPSAAPPRSCTRRDRRAADRRLREPAGVTGTRRGRRARQSPLNAEGPAEEERGLRCSSRFALGECRHHCLVRAGVGRDGSSRTTGRRNAWGREEGFRCVWVA